MEMRNERTQPGLVHRAVALGLAFATTAVIATGTAVIFTSAAPGASFVRIAVAPLRAMFGG